MCPTIDVVLASAGRLDQALGNRHRARCSKRFAVSSPPSRRHSSRCHPSRRLSCRRPGRVLLPLLPAVLIFAALFLVPMAGLVMESFRLFTPGRIGAVAGAPFTLDQLRGAAQLVIRRPVRRDVPHQRAGDGRRPDRFVSARLAFVRRFSAARARAGDRLADHADAAQHAGPHLRDRAHLRLGRHSAPGAARRWRSRRTAVGISSASSAPGCCTTSFRSRP